MQAGVHIIACPFHCAWAVVSRARLAGEEEQDVALRLGEVDLHDRDQRRVHVVALGRLGVQDLDRVRAPRDREDRAAEEVAGELRGPRAAA